MATPLYTKPNSEKYFDTPGTVVTTFLSANDEVPPYPVQRSFYLGTTEDIPNLVFTSISDAVDYFAESAGDELALYYNNQYGTDYAYAGYTYFDVPQKEIVDAKQPLSPALTAFAAMAPLGNNKMVHTDGSGNLVSNNIADFLNFLGVTAALNGKFATPTGTTSQYIRGDGSLATLPSAPTRTFNNPTRSLNTSYQVSTTQDAVVNVSVDVSCALTLAGGQTGTVFLEYADDSGMTTNLKECSRFVNGNTGTLTVGLNITQNATGTLTGVVPAGKYVRIRTANTAGTPTFTFRSAQEVLL